MSRRKVSLVGAGQFGAADFGAAKLGQPAVVAGEAIERLIVEDEGDAVRAQLDVKLDPVFLRHRRREGSAAVFDDVAAVKPAMRVAMALQEGDAPLDRRRGEEAVKPGV